MDYESSRKKSSRHDGPRNPFFFDIVRKCAPPGMRPILLGDEIGSTTTLFIPIV